MCDQLITIPDTYVLFGEKIPFVHCLLMCKYNLRGYPQVYFDCQSTLP